MATSRFEFIGKLMLEYAFVSEANEELTCIICKKLISDACQSFCGCHFCYVCVNSLIDNGDKYCPGGKKYCKDEHLEFEINVFRNAMLNKKISKLVVNCPNQLCKCNIELEEMYDHLGLCSTQSVSCPFAKSGCKMGIGNNATMVKHLHEEIFAHSEILSKSIDIMKNEIVELKEGFWKSQSEITWLKEQLANKEDRIVALEEDLREIRNEVNVNEITQNIKIHVDDKSKQIENSMIERENNLRNDIKNDFDNHKLEIVSRQEKSRNDDNRIVTLKKELKQFRNEIERNMKEMTNKMNTEKNEQRQQIENMKKERQNVMTQINTQTNDRNRFRDDSKIYSDVIVRKITHWIKWSQLCPSITADFMWKFDQCTKKTDTHMYSESFYSNNYKLCLRMWIYSHSDNIGLFCYIMKGVDDDKLQWPMSRTVTLSIINQDTMKAHKSDTFQGYDSAFNRPMLDKNEYYIGTPSFITYSSIKNKAHIFANDAIIVSCLLSE